MEIKKLYALIKVVETGSFSKAAASLNYTQSGITHMMKSIEREMGLTLFHRDFNGIRLTPDGEHLMPFIKDAAKKYTKLESEINFIKNNHQITLFIGAYSSVALLWLPEITKRYREKHPEITLEFSHYTVEGMRSAIRNGEIDVGFGSQPTSEFEWLALHNDPLLAILPKDYELSKDTFDIKDFDNKDFLMPSYGFDEDILSVLNKNDVHPKIKPTSVDDSVVISMVGCNLGLSILSDLVMKTGNFKEVKAVSLNPNAYRTLGIAALPESTRKKHIKDFIEISKEYVTEIYSGANNE